MCTTASPVAFWTNDGGPPLSPALTLTATWRTHPLGTDCRAWFTIGFGTVHGQCGLVSSSVWPLEDQFPKRLTVPPGPTIFCPQKGNQSKFKQPGPSRSEAVSPNGPEGAFRGDLHPHEAREWVSNTRAPAAALAPQKLSS